MPEHISEVIAAAMGGQFKKADEFALADPRYHAEVPAAVFDQAVDDLMGLAQGNYDLSVAEAKIRDALGKSLTPKREGVDPVLANALRLLRTLDSSNKLTIGPVARAVLRSYIDRLEAAVLAIGGPDTPQASDLIAAVADEVRLIGARDADR